MSYETKTARVDRFAGLSDRSHPAGLTRIENPSVLNIDFSDRKARRRYGYTRVNSERLKDGSIRLDGKNDYLLIPDHDDYDITGIEGFYVGFGVVLRSKPTNAAGWTIASKGFGATTDRLWEIRYDSATLTNPNGAWAFISHDSVNGVQLSEIADGDGGHSPIDEYRFIEMWIDLDVGGPRIYARMWDEDGNVTNSSVVTGGSYSGTLAVSDRPITIGVTETAAGTLDTTFADISICEFRYWVGDFTEVSTRLAQDTTFGSDRHIRELIPTEYDVYTGYWKLNDGTHNGILEDQTSTGNNGLIPENPASWVSTEGEVLGPSGIQFFGHNAFVALWETTAVQYLQNPFNTTSGQQLQRWTVRGIFVPKLGANESTVRDQTIFWAGTSATIPAPLALQITSNTWVASYRDGATTRTAVVSAVGFRPTDLVDKRVRFAISRQGTAGASNATVRLAITYIDGSGVQQQTFTNTTLVTNTTPDTMSGFWFLGRHVTSVTLPYTFASTASDAGAYGVIDDFQVIHTNSLTASPVSHGGASAFTERSSWGTPHFVVAHLKMNEGGGDLVRVTSEVPQTLLSFLYPEPDDGAQWDVGLVRPYRSPECGGLFEFDRLKTDNSFERIRLVQHGCTWSKINLTTGEVEAIGATHKATGKWTKTQYAQLAFLAGDNGRRPVIFDGARLINLGIKAPLSAPVATPSGGGTFTGSYYFYVTYYNKDRAIESNPGPGVQYTLTANSITALVLPVSPDPQVTGRRLYVTMASGADGSLAFLLAEFDDNTQTSWGPATTPFPLTAITAPVSSGRQLEYFDHEEAPISSIARVNGDNLFLAGDPVFPTRVYRSSVGEPWYFNQEDRNVDLDLDSGDPITGFATLVDSLFVGLRDGWGRVWNTGRTADPIGRAVLSRDHGPVGPHAMVAVDRLVYYLSERDIYRTDGLSEENITSPPRPDFPSVQEKMKSGMNALRRHKYVMAYYKGRKQLWCAYSSTPVAQDKVRNDRVLVYDISQGVFSDYELALDFLTELEDDNDTPTLYGVSEGYVVKLDQSGSADGVTPQRITVVTYTAGECPQVTYSGSAIDGAHGAPAYCYRRATNDVVTATCEYSEAGILRFYKKDLGLAAGDIIIVGAIRDYFDLILNFGEDIFLKRMNNLKIAGQSLHADTYVRLQWAKHQSTRTPTFVTAHQRIKPWPVASDMLRFEMGGRFRTARVRLSLCDDATDIWSDDPWPSTVLNAPTIYELLAEADVVNAE